MAVSEDCCVHASGTSGRVTRVNLGASSRRDREVKPVVEEHIVDDNGASSRAVEGRIKGHNRAGPTILKNFVPNADSRSDLEHAICLDVRYLSETAY